MEKYEELSKLSTEELKRRYDGLAQSTVPGLNFYREEIARRDAKEVNDSMHVMTKHMRNMTILISVLTIINVGALIYQLCNP